MNEYEKARRLTEDIRQIYPAGTRIILLSMEDPQAVPVGTRGTVKNIDDMAHIDMEWNNGRTLSLVPLVDSFRKLTEQELAEERLSAAKVSNADKEMLEENVPAKYSLSPIQIQRLLSDECPEVKVKEYMQPMESE